MTTTSRSSSSSKAFYMGRSAVLSQPLEDIMKKVKVVTHFQFASLSSIFFCFFVVLDDPRAKSYDLSMDILTGF